MLLMCGAPGHKVIKAAQASLLCHVKTQLAVQPHVWIA